MKRLFRVLLIVLFVRASNVALRADDAREALERGHAAFAQGRYDEAIREYKAATSVFGEEAALAHFNIGVCHQRLGRAAAAVTHYRTAIQMRGGYAKASYALGLALVELGRYDEAKAAFTACVKASEGKHAEALFELGLLALGAGNDAAAAKLFSRAVKRGGKRFPAAHNNLGVLFARHGDVSAAEREFVLALEQSGGRFTEAAHNLRLCRRIENAAASSVIAALQLSSTTADN